MLDPLAQIHMMSRYNSWANRCLYMAAAELAASEWTQDCGVFFRSMQGTLNHLLVADRIWMARFTGEGPNYEQLDLVLHPGLAELTAARRAEDARIERYADGLTLAQLGGPLRYANTSGKRFEQPLWEALAHFFNHQTHHRGHAHAVLSRLGRKPPSLDLLVYQRSRPPAAA